MHLFRFLAAFGLFIASVSAVSAQQAEPPVYVGSETCAGCHKEQAELWASSHHALAWTLPTPETVIADFDGTQFEHDGMRVDFRIEDGTYRARVVESDGTETDYPIHSVAGITPLQQYLIETEPGRLQSFDVVWDAREKHWYHLYPDQHLPVGDGLHWTGPYKTWNARCAECHATGYSRNYSPRTRKYDSRQAEIGVGCEACHGPASAHVAWAEGKADAGDPGTYGFAFSFGRGDVAADIGQCAGCHSRREAIGDGNPVPGTPYADAYTLSLLVPGLYQADGQMLDEVYVYGSFLQSKMHQRGVSCMNCHEPHGGTLVAEGNAVCAQCHSPAGNPAFPTLRPAVYDDPSHHHHADGSDGAQCKSCHMPQRTYMGTDRRRDHSFRVPRPDLGAETGATDACTDCHADRDQAWAAASIAGWFPQPDRRGAHYGQVFAQAARDPAAAMAGLRDIAVDGDKPAIVRATALYFLMPSATPELADELAPLLADPDPLVRGSAAQLQRGAPPAVRADRLMPVLGDPVASVRIAAAKQMFDVQPADLRPSQRAAVQEAASEWQRSLASRLDFPETHLVLAGIGLTLRDAPVAERAFREVVRLDPQRREAWPMLVRLAQITGGPAAARRVLAEALSHLPQDPDLLHLKSQMGGG